MTCIDLGNEESVQLAEGLSKIAQFDWSVF